MFGVFMNIQCQKDSEPLTHGMEILNQIFFKNVHHLGNT